MIRYKDKPYNVNPTFKVYFHTRKKNSAFPPEIQAEVSIINFDFTDESIMEQIINIVLKRESEVLFNTRTKFFKE